MNAPTTMMTPDSNAERTGAFWAVYTMYHAQTQSVANAAKNTNTGFMASLIQDGSADCKRPV